TDPVSAGGHPDVLERGIRSGQWISSGRKQLHPQAGGLRPVHRGGSTTGTLLADSQRIAACGAVNMDDATRPLSILIVEDSSDDADLLLLELRRAGMQVRSRRVDTGPAMRAAMQADRYDLILCDHTMPAFDSQGALAI